MKNQLLTILTLCITIQGFAQISFEKGFYIDNSGQKTDCLIKNIDWKNNPTEFEYKLLKTSEKQVLSIKDVQSFEIYNAAKYERHTLLVDVSNQNLKELETSDQPNWEERQLFLKVLINGKASLYSYVDGNLRKYFFKKDDAKVEQLIYKKYMVNPTSMGENNQFRRQLWNMFNCGNIPTKIKNVDYKKKDLIKIFEAYNSCEGGSFENYEENVKRDHINLSIKPGVNFSSVVIGNSSLPNYNFDFEDKTSFQLGVEAEFILNFNNNKWAIVVEPTYVSYKAEQEFIYIQTPSETRTTNVVIDYTAIEVPFGVRYYSFINDSSKLFINAFYMFNITLNDELYAERRELLQAKITPRGNLAFGIGYKYDNTFSVEFRYKTPRQLFPTNPLWGTYDYNSVAVIFGYTIF